MKYEQVADLLEKYFAGETTLEEERLLKNYFSGGGIDKRLENHKPLFLALKAERQVEFSGEAKSVKIQSGFSRRIYQYAIAASVAGLLVLGFWWKLRQQPENQALAAKAKLYEDTFDDPEKAAAEIKAALALVSSKMKKGKKEAAKGLKKLEAADKYFPKPR